MSDFRQNLVELVTASNERQPTPVMIDYAAANRAYRRQKAALTRAENSGDPSRVVKTCRKTVIEWCYDGYPWPDDWSRWQRALDDAIHALLGWHAGCIDLRELTRPEWAKIENGGEA